jgi:hypothetical protein
MISDVTMPRGIFDTPETPDPVCVFRLTIRLKIADCSIIRA